MGGTVIESESERLVRVGKEEGISEGISIGEEKVYKRKCDGSWRRNGECHDFDRGYL